jgi:hypothetical protein
MGRRGGSKVVDCDISSAYGSAEPGHLFACHRDDPWLYQQGSFVQKKVKDEYMPSNVYDAHLHEYEGPWVHQLKKLDRKCLLCGCEERCGHVQCSWFSNWRGISVDI